MENEKKLFAFKLAEKQTTDADRTNEKWKARNGVALAACTPGAIHRPIYIPTGLGDSPSLCV